MAKNISNIFMGGSEDDALWLGPIGTDLSAITLDVDLSTISGLVDAGWLSDDGLVLDMKDSQDTIKAYQGAKIVRTYMKSSENNFSATLLETNKTFPWYTSGTVTKQTVGEHTVAHLTIPSARKIVPLVMVWDTYDADDPNIHARYWCDRIELGERGKVSWKNGDIVGYDWDFTAIEDIEGLSTHPGLLAGLA